MHGVGEFTWPNNIKFVGNYWNGKRHGEGTFYLSDGKKFEGMWENGNQTNLNE